jgi:hypothetical protein
MVSSSREWIVARFDALHDAVSGVLELSYEALTTPERLRLLERLEDETRRLPVPGHELINQVRQRPARQSWAASLRMRWPTGCASAARRPTGASMKPRI